MPTPYDNQNRRPPATTPTQGRRPQNGSRASAHRLPTPRKSAAPRRQRVRYRWFSALLMVIGVVAFSIFFAQFILAGASELFGLRQTDRVYNITIPENADISLVTGILSDAGVISQSVTFQLYANFKFGTDDVIHPGEYVFNSNMGYDQIFTLLKVGTNRNRTVTLTFIEGITLSEIADMLEEEGVCSREDFIAYLDTEELDYEFVRDIQPHEHRFLKLEGYIFPDTYEFYIGERVNSVAKKFLDNFSRRIDDDMRRRMEALDMTLDEVVTLASIIQKEAGHPGHMRRVSSVFHNRLKSSAYPLLQSDVTIFYVEHNIKPYTGAESQPMYDVYNTYVTERLPVGPVSNPGLEAIRAALYPSETSFFFFVTDVHGEFYYAESLAQHNQNIRSAVAADESGQGLVYGIDTGLH